MYNEFPDTELGRRLRANRGRRLRPAFDVRFEEALGYRPSDSDFLDIPATDKLWKQTASTETVSRLFPESGWPGFRARLYDLAGRLGRGHYSYLTHFEDWEYLGAVRVRSGDLIEAAESFWKPGYEELALVTEDSSDGFWLAYNGPDLMPGDYEYELECWGVFQFLGDS